MEDLFRLRCRSSRISCCSVSNQKLLRVVHCRQPVLGIVLVTHLRLLMEALGCHVSVGIISECILFRQVPLTYGCLCHLVIRIIGVGVLPANSHFLRTAGPHSPDSPGHIKRTVLEISRAERGLRPANQYRALSQKAMPSQSVR